MVKKQPIWGTKRYYDTAHTASLDVSHPALQLIKVYAQKSQKILEVGCGEGTKLYKLTPENKARVGVDISQEAIKRAQKNYPQIKFKVGDAKKLPFKNEEFDLVFSAFFIEHIKQPERIISEIIRVTKSYLILVAPNFGAPNRASPCFKGNRIVKLITGIFKDYLWSVKPPKNLFWLRVKPIATIKNYQIDWDTTIEPYILSLKLWLSQNKLKLIHCSSLWEVKEGKEKTWQKLFKILGMMNLYPFKFWGPHLVVVAGK